MTKTYREEKLVNPTGVMVNLNEMLEVRGLSGRIIGEQHSVRLFGWDLPVTYCFPGQVVQLLLWLNSEGQVMSYSLSWSFAASRVRHISGVHQNNHTLATSPCHLMDHRDQGR